MLCKDRHRRIGDPHIPMWGCREPKPSLRELQQLGGNACSDSHATAHVTRPSPAAAFLSQDAFYRRTACPNYQTLDGQPLTRPGNRRIV